MGSLLVDLSVMPIRPIRLARLLLCTCLAVGLLAGCSDKDPPGMTSRGPAGFQGAVEVLTAPAVVKPLGVDLEAVGTARSNESAEVTSKTSNIVTAIKFEEGALVRRGAVLVELDNAETMAALAEAEAQLADSERQFGRSRDLAAQQALSASQLDVIEATLKGNRARVEAARARLSDTVIRAGFDGRTGFRRVSVGSVINPGTVITTLDDASIIKLDFTVPENFVFMLKRGLPVTASTAGLRGRAFKGTVTNLDSRVDPTTRSIFVRAEIPNPEGVLRPGMFMTVALQGDVIPTLLVPEAAIVPEQGRTYVFVVANGVAERREVSVGRRRPGEAEVTVGLKEGERVVTDGTQNLQNGSKIHDQAPPKQPGPESSGS
jgi:membrane fusion protein, multidrug efflux system